MEQSIEDKAVDKLIQRFARFEDKLRSKYKGVKPFRQMPVSNDEMLVQYNMMREQDFDAMAQKVGTQGTIDFINKMENLKARRQENA